jgi:PhnB protein
LRFRRNSDHRERSTSSTTITPYLYFAGRCEEALEFYCQALGAQIDMIMRFNQSPQPTPPGMLQAGFEDKVMYASFHVGQVGLMASDGCDDKSKCAGMLTDKFNVGCIVTVPGE